MSRELLEQALEALDDLIGYDFNGDPFSSSDAKAKKVMDDIREHLARTKEPEPVAWINAKGDYVEVSRKDTVYGSHTIPLYRKDQL